MTHGSAGGTVNVITDSISACDGRGLRRTATLRTAPWDRTALGV